VKDAPETVSRRFGTEESAKVASAAGSKTKLRED